MKIIFFDMDKEKVKSYQKVLNIVNEKNEKTFFHHSGEIKLDFVYSELNNLISDHKINIIVSPANSYGHMTGGIDRDICKINDTIKNKVSLHVNKSIYMDMDNKPYVPVGLCEPVKINEHLTILIVPTMKHPKDITGTNNVFLAFNSILIYLKSYYSNHHNTVIACPCLGTGIGNMSADDSAKQILHAFLVHQIV
jgi:O-acetyl-ADP-ribose deacetylase (regulator of RNase III)